MGNIKLNKQTKWQEPSIPQENPPLLRPQRRPWPPRPRPPRPQVVSREHTDSDQELLPLDTSESIKNQLSSSLENSHSKDSSDTLLTTSRPTLDSNHQLSLPSKKPLKPTWSDFSKTPTFAPSTPRELPSCQRICNSPRESEEKEPEQFEESSTDFYLTSSCDINTSYRYCPSNKIYSK